MQHWCASGRDPGCSTRAQSEALAAELRVDLRRTNPFLRAGLALFTTLIVAALVGLVMVSLDIRNAERDRRDQRGRRDRVSCRRRHARRRLPVLPVRD